MLKNLILKELKLLKTNILLSIVVGILFAYVGAVKTVGFVSQIIYIYIVVFLVYLGLMFMSYKESKAKSDIIFNSMPTKRAEIVKSKYLTVLLYLLMIVSIIYLGSNVFAIFIDSGLGEAVKIVNILLVLGISLFFISIYLPFEFYNIGKVQIFNTIFYVLLFLTPNIITKYGNKIVDSSIFKMIIKFNFTSIAIILLGFSIILYIISIYISIAIYKRKEF